MKMASLTDQSITLLQKVLDLRAEKEKIIASNIANAETPGYSAVKFKFEDQLKVALSQKNVNMQTTHENHLPFSPTSIENVSGQLSLKKDTTGIGDGNSVSLEEEMLDLSENQLLYETAAQLLKKKLSLRKYVIQGGGQ